MVQLRRDGLGEYQKMHQNRKAKERYGEKKAMQNSALLICLQGLADFIKQCGISAASVSWRLKSIKSA